MRRILVTGCNRGLGLEFARQLLERGERVFATCRHPDQAHELRSLVEAHGERASLLQLDVGDPQSIEASWQAISQQTDVLDWLINNAGLGAASVPADQRAGHNQLGKLDWDSQMHAYRTNTLGPLMIAQRYLDLLRAGEDARIANISTRMSSLTEKHSGGSYSYVISKAALNMATRALAFDLVREGIVAIVINPGWIKTDMGGQGAPLTPEQSVGGMLRLIDGLAAADARRFIRWDGETQAW